MENDDGVRRLMEQLLPCLYNISTSNLTNIFAQESFVPDGFITSDFFQKICIVSSTKQVLISQKWKNFFDVNCLKMVSSHETYLEYIMLACVIECGLSNDIFNSFIKVCALVIAFNIGIFKITGINFYDLNVDIFMVWYRSAMKEQFCIHGGFERFTEYLRHEYLTLEYCLNESVPVDDRDRLLKSADNQLDIELDKVLNQPDYLDDNDVKISVCHTLAKELLSTTKVKLPTLPSSDDLSAARKQKVARLEEINRSDTEASNFETTGDSKCEAALKRFANLVSHAQTSTAIQKNAEIAWCDNIVRAVTHYNNSKSSIPVKENDLAQKAEKILEHLKETIESLIEVLNEQDKG